MGKVHIYNKGDKTILLREGTIYMDASERVLVGIETDFVERKLNAKVVEGDSYKEAYIFIAKDFLDMFDVREGVTVGGELLSPCWGKCLDDNLDTLPYWMAQVKYKKVNRNRLGECLEQIEKAIVHHKRRNRN